MYDVIYDELVEAGVAIHLDNPVFTDRDGKEVEEDERFGLKQDIKITHPHYIMFADETGCNTSQKKDGHVGGTKLIVEKGTVPQVMSSDTDHKFTLLPFTSASGEAVCCVVIFQSKTGQVPMQWRMGIDASVNPIRGSDGEIDVEMNIGEGKFHPGGPKCKYNGKEVDCLAYATESGGITGDILVQILTYFDEIDLFPRVPGGPIPVLIVDGHQSRLDPAFIEYINDKGHQWMVCFGVPYATTIWQVGDASELNGKFKIEWYREKGFLLVWKYTRRLTRSIKPYDIMPILNKIFHKSFGNLQGNMKAVSDRGWFPPNRKLLEHPSLINDAASEHAVPSSADTSSSSTSCAMTLTLNIGGEEGMTATVLDRMLTERARSEGAKKAGEKRKQEGQDAAANIRDAKRLTTGVLTANGIHSLRDPEFLEPFRARECVCVFVFQLSWLAHV